MAEMPGGFMPRAVMLSLVMMLMTSRLAFGGIHNACHSTDKDSRVFAVACAGAVIDPKADEMKDGKRVYQMPQERSDEAHSNWVCGQRFPDL